jgi:hypothetical protein
MNKNFECDLYSTEEDTIKNCSNIEIDTIFKKEIGRGTIGVIYPVRVKIGSKKLDLVFKKISTIANSKNKQQRFIKNMYYEVDYSYKMGEHDIGPQVYDAFFYIKNDEINQFILMEKFQNSVSNWLLSESTNFNQLNCNYVANKMLELLHKQIFVLETYCSDIKVDNFVINFKPLKIRMIDFGIEWCKSYNLPDAYMVVESLRNHSNLVKKEIFYCLCILQLFINIIHINIPLPITKMILRSFYKDDLFIKYVLVDTLQKEMDFGPVESRPKRKSRRSRSNIRNDFNIKKILYEILEYGHDQAITLRHYLQENPEQSNSEIVIYVFAKIKKMAKLIFKNKN